MGGFCQLHYLSVNLFFGLREESGVNSNICHKLSVITLLKGQLSNKGQTANSKKHTFYWLIKKILKTSIFYLSTCTSSGQLAKSCFNETHLEFDFNGTHFYLYVMLSEIKCRFALVCVLAIHSDNLDCYQPPVCIAFSSTLFISSGLLDVASISHDEKQWYLRCMVYSLILVVFTFVVLLS